jgi:predicted metal-dependent phosphoesterase TrpH
VSFLSDKQDKFDLHLHSYRSYDSFSRIEAILSQAKKRGLKGVAITDHESPPVEGLERIAASYGVWIIKGCEVQTEIGDILCLFVDKMPSSKKALELIDEVKAQNGITVLPHPFKYKKKYPMEIIEKIDAIEIVNGRWIDLRLNMHRYETERLLSIVKGRSAGSDAHFTFEIGRAYWCSTNINKIEDLKNSIKLGRGEAKCNHFSGLLDWISQFVKFIKNPSLSQFARAVLWPYKILLR